MKLNYVNCFDRVRGIKTRNSFIVKHLKFLFYIFVFAPQKCPKSVNQRTNVLHFYEDFLFCIYGWFRMNGTEWPVSWQSRVNTEQPTLTTSTTPDQFVFFFCSCCCFCVSRYCLHRSQWKRYGDNRINRVVFSVPLIWRS